VCVCVCVCEMLQRNDLDTYHLVRTATNTVNELPSMVRSNLKTRKNCLTCTHLNNTQNFEMARLQVLYGVYSQKLVSEIDWLI